MRNAWKLGSYRQLQKQSSRIKTLRSQWILSFYLSFFISKIPCKVKASIYATYQLSFSPFTKCAHSLQWSEHVYWVSVPQLPLSFPFLSFPFRFLPDLLQVGWRWGWVYNLEKQNTRERERERERLHQVVYSDSSRLLQPSPSRGRQVYKDTAL